MPSFFLYYLCTVYLQRFLKLQLFIILNYSVTFWKQTEFLHFPGFCFLQIKQEIHWVTRMENCISLSRCESQGCSKILNVFPIEEIAAVMALSRRYLAPFTSTRQILPPLVLRIQLPFPHFQDPDCSLHGSLSASAIYNSFRIKNYEIID